MTSNKNTSDNELVEKLRRGDLEAFNWVFEKYGDRLFGFALKYLKSKEATEELVQEIFLKVWLNRNSLKKDTSLKSYLFTISYHDICKFFRKKQQLEMLKGKIGSFSDISVDTEEQIDYHSTLEQIERLIEKLTPQQRIIFTKSRKEGKSTREIAEEMHLAPGTVDNHISAALKFLRKHISDKDLALALILAVFIQ